MSKYEISFAVFHGAYLFVAHLLQLVKPVGGTAIRFKCFTLKI